MPENPAREERAASTPPKTSGGTFGQRKEDIYKRLQESAEQCRLYYDGRTELATESDDNVAALCEALEDAFNYGLRQQQTTSLFQNMQEIVTGNIATTANDTTFWDFCKLHLTQHERERYENLKQVWTKVGWGRAFVRATLNESSLQRYLLTWLSDEAELRSYFSPWSLLLDAEISKELSRIVGSLNKVLFALTADTTELNSSSRSATAIRKEEPIIYAPSPIPVATVKHKRKVNAVERPIATTIDFTDELLARLGESSSLNAAHKQPLELVEEELVASSIEDIESIPPDPIEPELEFLKQPLSDLYSDCNITSPLINNGDTVTIAAASDVGDDKSETSSQYSKSSSAFSASHANCSSNNAALEQKLQEVNERCALLETRVAQLSLENRQLKRRLMKQFNESGIDPSSSLAANFLITIPHVKLLKSKRPGGGSFYSYEIHITMRQHLEHWLLHRRYREFDKLHKTLLKTHPSVAVVDLPPKKHFGNMNLIFVEERRQQLQIYLLNLVESLPQVEACKSKAELQKVFPFFRER